MTRFLSAIRRLPDNDFAQDACALMAIGAFLVFAIWGEAGLSAMVSAWRLGQ